MAKLMAPTPEPSRTGTGGPPAHDARKDIDERPKLELDRREAAVAREAAVEHAGGHDPTPVTTGRSSVTPEPAAGLS
jgi:hypothetical protein